METEDPIPAKSKTDKEAPSFGMPKIEKDEARRAKLLKDIAAPK
jgi:hypothetical protein